MQAADDAFGLIGAGSHQSSAYGLRKGHGDACCRINNRKGGKVACVMPCELVRAAGARQGNGSVLGGQEDGGIGAEATNNLGEDAVRDGNGAGRFN